MTEKELLRKACEHGVLIGAYEMSSLPESYRPLTFDSWYEQLKIKQDET